MFGLLAGLIGGAMMRGMAARRPMGGALSGLLGRRGSGGASPMGRNQTAQAPAPSQSPMQTASAAPQQEKQPQPEAPPPEAAAPQSQPLVNSAPTEMSTKPQALSGLLEDPKPIAAAPPPSPDRPIPTQSIVNTTDSPTPTARPITEQFGSVPSPEPSEMVDRITDNPPRLTVELPDANPSKTPDLGKQSYTADQGYRYPAPASVGSMSMPFRYKRV